MHTFNTVARIIVGSGACGDLASHLQSIAQGANNVLMVSDDHLQSLGTLDPAIESLRAAGIGVTLFTDVVPDPPESLVLQCLSLAKTAQVDAVVAIGGGSSMDLAKVVAVLAHTECQQSIADMYGVDQVKGARLPLLLAPSTAGTGSEVTPIAIITTGETTKAGIVSPQLYADMAILDPALTASLPPAVAAVTGIDAMVHAIESYTSKIKKNPVSDQLARGALTLLTANIEPACQPGPNEKVRENMLVGAMQAGQAFANAPVAAIHALAYPLGGHYHLSHGLTNALMMLPVMRFNMTLCSRLYAELGRQLHLYESGSDAHGAQLLVDYMEALLQRLQVPLRLRDHAVSEDFLDRLATDAMLQTRLLVNNPREVSEQDALALYREAW